MFTTIFQNGRKDIEWAKRTKSYKEKLLASIFIIVHTMFQQYTVGLVIARYVMLYDFLPYELCSGYPYTGTAMSNHGMVYISTFLKKIL